MARGGYFVHDNHGYGYVLNASPEIGAHCQLQGEFMAASAGHQSGADYTVDTQHGFTRFHTRVTIPQMLSEDGSWNRGYFRETRLHALPVALTQWGGRMGGFQLKPRPWHASRKKR